MRPAPVPEPAATCPVEVNAAFVAEAVGLGLDPPGLAEAAVRSGISAEKARRWREENAGAIASDNREREQNGLWSGGLRLSDRD